MKTKVFCSFLFGSVLLSLFMSCQKDEEDVKSELRIDCTGMMVDGGAVAGVWFEGTNFVNGTFSDHEGDSANHDKHLFSIKLAYEGSYDIIDDLEETTAIAKAAGQYYQEKTLPVLVEAKKRKQLGQVIAWPMFHTAYVNGEVSITCDKVLFGEKPGANLCKYFLVESYADFIPVGIENPRILYGFGEVPTNMAEFFVEGTWLVSRYDLKFHEEPTERYDELTFHLSMPILKEHSRDYIVAKAKGEETELMYSELTAEADCTIRYDKE